MEAHAEGLEKRLHRTEVLTEASQWVSGLQNPDLIV